MREASSNSIHDQYDVSGDRYVVRLDQVDSSQVARVGGKGAHLGELSRIEGVRVPAGFCVTTDAFQRVLTQVPSLDAQLDALSRLAPADRDTIRALSARIRGDIERIVIPDDVKQAITHALIRLGDGAACAVRSSATAEDLPGASFAGQQDTYLNVIGPAAILAHVSRCWASLFTERAVTYRLRNGFDHRKVRMAVVVQRMVLAQASGVLFTADPVSGHRRLSSIEACVGLGEALVSGRVNADNYKVTDAGIVAKTIASKASAIHAMPEGGTGQAAIEPEQQAKPALTDAQAVRLALLGRGIEAHFGCPQDIEWCLADDDFQIVQSRPITTLFPIPDASDGENHVYLSVGHQQMMTDPMRPLGISIWQGIGATRFHEAGGRLFVDVSRTLASPKARAGLLAMTRKADPLIANALDAIIERGNFIVPQADDASGNAPEASPPEPLEIDPAIVDALIARNVASVAEMKRGIQGRSGSELFDFIADDLTQARKILFDPRSNRPLFEAIDASAWLNEHLHAWLGEKNAADVLTQSVPNNITSEMGLALLDVADAIRPHADVVSFLQRVQGPGFLDDMAVLDGGTQARAAILAWLERYGMRCPGEIDITNARWSERPDTLVPLLLGNVLNFGPGAGRQRFEQGLQQARSMEQDVLQRLRALPDGAHKAEDTKRMIDRVRTFIGYREYPKYGMVSRYFVYKQALMAEARRLLQAGVIAAEDDIFYLSFAELQQAVREQRVDPELIARRRDAFDAYKALTPPRVLTSDGETLSGAYLRDDLPAGALAGLAVSAGTVEGRARVVFDIAKAELEPGDILVTPFTDPSWTPLFVAIKGLVTEVGGLMTHGAVIAREYGLPAVVSVQHATRLIKDGQRIRVHGTQGYVEIVR